MNNLNLRLEAPSDYYEVENLTREAFWNTFRDPGHCICDEHLLIHRLRKGQTFVPELNYIAELNNKLVGHIIYTKCKVVDDLGKSHEMLTFGPISVLPEYQNIGIGKALMTRTFKVAKQLGYRAVIIFGHPNYYPRVGFKPAIEFGITTSDGSNFDAFMAYPLFEGALNGIQGKSYFDPAYEDLNQDDVLEFDKQFTPKSGHSHISMDVLLERLNPNAKKAIQALGFESLALLQTKSYAEILALDGMNEETFEIIRNVMKEFHLPW